MLSVFESARCTAGIQAIEAPQEGKHAFRLTANLLLGVSKIHSIQVHDRSLLDMCVRECVRACVCACVVSLLIDITTKFSMRRKEWRCAID